MIGRNLTKFVEKILLEFGFCNKSFRKDEPLTSWTLFSTYLSSKLDSPLIKTLERIIFSSNQNIGEGESNFDDKYVEKSVQLVRGSSFRNDLLQNPYFSHFDVPKPIEANTKCFQVDLDLYIRNIWRLLKGH